MRRVAVFGNAGGGKSTLSRRLSTITGLPLHSVDLIKYRPGGVAVSHEDNLKTHGDIVARDEWIIDGYGCTASSWDRFDRADTLIHVDLPVMRHRWWVAKRLIEGFISTPEGWPEGSPMWRSTLSSFKVIEPCHRHLTPKYGQLASEATSSKSVHHLRPPAEIEAFPQAVEREFASSVSISN